MSAATDLRDAVAARLGAAEPTIHTSIPPLQFGGNADVLEFRHVTDIPGAVYLSAGGNPEIVMCARGPAAWAAPMVAAMGAATLQRSFLPNGSVPLGDPGSPFAGLAIAHVPRLDPMSVSGRHVRFVLAIGVTGAELALCRSHGVLHLVELLRRAGSFPYSEPGRGDVAGIGDAGPPPLERAGLSAAGQRALGAVVHGQDQDTENLRGTIPASDLPALAAAYAALGAWEQRAGLVILTQDAAHPQLEAIRRAFVAEAPGRSIEHQSGEHMALATALSILDGDHRTFNTYWKRVDAAVDRARTLSES